MSPDVRRLVRVVDGFRNVLEEHERSCGIRVSGIALNPADHTELCLAEVWGVQVLAWDDVEPGRCRLLCETCGVLIPEIETFEELMDQWQYQL